MTSLSVQTAWSQAEFIKANGDVADEHPQSVATVDSLALVALYHSLNGETWRDDTGWLEDMVTFWNGVSRIDEIEVEEGVFENRVTRLSLFENPLNMTQCGYLTHEIANMEYLEQFHIAREFVCGEIPEEIFDLEFMSSFRVRGNYMTGEIPWDAIGNSRVENLSIEQNNWVGPVMTAGIANSQWLENIVMDEADLLTGSFPPEFTQLENLSRFGADGLTRIEGPMPDFSQMPNIDIIEIQYSNFDPGPWPAWLEHENIKGDEGISRLAIHGTNIQGPVPQSILELTNVTELKIGGMEMGMDMADFPDMSLMPSLRRFRIWGGNFTGGIPDWFQHLDVDRLWIAYTDMSGDLPAFMGQMERLNLLKIRNNQFTGGIPATFQNLTSLGDLVLEYNNMEIGPIPDFIGNNMSGINKLYLAGSGVTGEIPQSLSQLEGLSHLRLQDNPELGGTLPSWLWDRELHALDISHTNIDLGGEFPSELQNQPDIYKLGLGGLGINGQIPSWLGELGFLRTDGTRDHFPYLALQDNNLTGEIPASFANLSTLDSLNLANNQLEGNIDVLQYVGRATQNPNEEPMLLSALDISGNPGLAGEIPSSFIGSSRLRVFHFEGTDLCMPDGLAEFLDPDEDERRARAQTAYTNRTAAYYSTTDPATATPCVVSTEVTTNPYQYRLHQSYPNPFNPTSTIQYEIADDVHVRLTVYNVLGQRVATLVNEPMNAGLHQVQFNARGLASGQYIYRLEAADRIMTQTMTLIK